MNPTADTGQLNLDWSAALIAGLAAAGVRDVVISPGSRSTPLTLACLRHPQLHCMVILDERSAAWFALGRAKADGLPVALVCTSGTAAANWLPAVVEANQSGQPLLLLSADRPPELQGWGANQTIDQTTLFSGQTRAYHAPGAPFPRFDRRWLQQLAARAVAESQWPSPGPVHLNLAFREPLLPAESTLDFGLPEPIEICRSALVPDEQNIAMLAKRLSGRRGVIFCGEGSAGLNMPAFAEAVTSLAATLGCPILAEPLSGLRFGLHPHDHVCSRHERWLRDETRCAAARPDWVLRFGNFPVTRQMQAFIGNCDEHYLVEQHGRWPDPLHQTRLLIRGDADAVCHALLAQSLAAASPAWLAAFRDAETAMEAGIGTTNMPPEAALFAQLCEALPADSRFFCGNSMPIRDLAAWSGGGDSAIRFYANRGASGIDGNIATAAGISASGPVVAVIGDLTAQHDIGSLALMKDRPLVLVVINNGGGGIFDFLPPAALPEFEAGWLTPQSCDFSAAAAAFGIEYQATDDPGTAATAALTSLNEGKARLIELKVNRLLSLQMRRAT
jgi:2-succinyl-5-enolpyruvyl-6-hydroxy-3-cyclohexene-1-carboxylate synthase